MSAPAKLRHHLCLLDVGHGNAAVLAASDHDFVLIYVGKHSALRLFLEEQQITRIATVYLSHADEDHIGALVGLLGSKEISIDRVFLNTDGSKGSKVWDDLIYELDAAHRAGKLNFETSLSAGHTHALTAHVSLEVIGPSRYLASKGPGGKDREGRKIRTNSISAVVAVTVGDRRLALLPGDLDAIGLDDLLRSGTDLIAPILVYPHHGGLPESTSPEHFARALLNAVQPHQVIFSIGRGQYRMPNPRTVAAVRKLLPNTRIVCTQLSEHCSRSLPRASALHLSQAFAQGRINQACCAGTIVVPLAPSTQVVPLTAQHATFIRTHVETPLCLQPSSP